ncbi:Uma2 family endonuclease [Thermoleptolyngbya sichuanensis XZ-Cy5]|uniref:Uma2 family endonuclease n=1 Tax=Thermoleptolyngbya sichuanensis TaxID=2885951 RepID=UPI00240D0947|nr:Uma2 family endonuclease [Thermoleptolyngbya sichuanensis]MDG2614979.1 Uma2 family endonuclease [Thermoleptolyngbya sichuanensis XZ-Cy5]
MAHNLLNDDAIVTELDISHLVTEDDTPVDNFQSEKQQRLLVEPLYSSWSPGIPFIAAANVGVFYALKQDPIVPDAMLSLGLEMPTDWSQKQNRSYFVWEFGKVPDVCIEIVSNREGDELALSRKSQQKGKTLSKKDLYARIGVPYYAVFDPLEQLQAPEEMDGSLLQAWALREGRYHLLQPPIWLEAVGLGLTLWEGEFEGVSGLWLRWCDAQGQVIWTGAEGQNAERQRAEAERQRAEAERQRAEAERQRAEAERQRADRLAERLRAMGVDPDEV